MEFRYSDDLASLEGELSRKLDTILDREESLWRQKFTGDWINFGDRNTPYYHLKVVRRRKQNRVERLRNEEGIWIDDQDQLLGMAVEFYSKLYTESEQHRPRATRFGDFPRINEDLDTQLRRPFTVEHVRQALFDMKPWKAPGVDGVQVGFYQRHWNLVGKDVSDTVLRVLAGEKIDHEMNRTILYLIPKVVSPSTLAQFWPIALCSVMYKLITKTLANRLKQLMPNIVGPCQASFVPGRRISDNIIVAQEAIHSMRYTKGRKGFMAIKVDLEKAYDRISWNFLVDTLVDTNIPAPMVNVIMECVTTTSMQVQWHG